MDIKAPDNRILDLSMADPNNKSLSISADVKEKAKAWVDTRITKGDDSIPSVANLVNRLLIAFLIETTSDPELKDIESKINKAAKHVSRHSN